MEARIKIKQQERRKTTLMEIPSRYNFHLDLDFHVFKTTNLQNYFFKMGKETSKTEKVKR